MSADGEGLGVSMIDPRQVRDWIRGGEHWVVAFGREFSWAIDSLDDAIAVYPTFPTLLLPVSMSFVPKAAFSVEAMQAWIDGVVETPPKVAIDRDVLVCTDDQAEALLMMRTIMAIAESSD